MEQLRTNKNLQISIVIAGFSLICIIFAFFVDSLSGLGQGLIAIITSKCGLITDYYAIGGMGATLINCGLTTLLCLGIYKISKSELNGLSLAILFTLAGFSFFGKNLLNIWPIIAGSYLYCLIFKVKFKSIIKIAMLSTSLAPLVSESYFILNTDLVILKLGLTLVIGVMIGFITPQIAKFTPQCHQGYILYNVGFASGIIGMIFIAFLNFFNVYVEQQPILSDAYSNESLIFILLVGIFFLIISLLINYKSVTKFLFLMRRPSRNGCDYVEIVGMGTTLLNMLLLSLVYAVVVLVMGVPLSGPVLAGIFTIIGFSAFGKNLYNTSFIVIGILLSAWLGHIEFTNINVILALLFGTCLAPIVNRYGPFLGIVAGILHVCLVMNVAILHSGLNLYNNGFAAGLLCIFLVPLYEELTGRFPNCILWKKASEIGRSANNFLE